MCNFDLLFAEQQAVQTCKELTGNNDTTAVINFCGDLLSFITKHTVPAKRLQASVADTDVFVAVILLSKLMDQADYNTQREITIEVVRIPGIYSAWKSMFNLIDHKGTHRKIICDTLYSSINLRVHVNECPLEKVSD